RNQTANIDKIVIVNNGSTDGTTEWLRTQTYAYVINQENSGGAGGFCTGVKYAFENGADWIWMMDDDVKPESDCLFELLKYGNVSKCLHPTKRYIDGVNYIWGEYFEIEKNYKFYLPPDQYQNKDLFFINNGCFEGMLINSEIVAKIGFPDSRFFIAGDDTIYGYLANQFTNVCVVKNAKMIRVRSSKENNLKPMYLYYELRNFHLFQEYAIKLSNANFPLSVKLRYYAKIIRSLQKSIFLREKLNYKIKLVRAIIMGFWHSKLKRINKSD
ncbi:MAG TPA: glycosyltransferase, partial [Prolixibacteraceae bacterium]